MPANKSRKQTYLLQKRPGEHLLKAIKKHASTSRQGSFSSCMMQCRARQAHVHGAYQPNLLQSTVASQPNLQSAEGGKGKAAVPAK